MPNLAALRAAIFLLSAKNRWGGAHMCPPPAVRGLNLDANECQDLVRSELKTRLQFAAACLYA